MFIIERPYLLLGKTQKRFLESSENGETAVGDHLRSAGEQHNMEHWARPPLPRLRSRWREEGEGGGGGGGGGRSATLSIRFAKVLAPAG